VWVTAATFSKGDEAQDEVIITFRTFKHAATRLHVSFFYLFKQDGKIEKWKAAQLHAICEDGSEFTQGSSYIQKTGGCAVSQKKCSLGKSSLGCRYEVRFVYNAEKETTELQVRATSILLVLLAFRVSCFSVSQSPHLKIETTDQVRLGAYTQF